MHTENYYLNLLVIDESSVKIKIVFYSSVAINLSDINITFAEDT